MSAWRVDVMVMQGTDRGLSCDSELLLEVLGELVVDVLVVPVLPPLLGVDARGGVLLVGWVESHLPPSSNSSKSSSSSSSSFSTSASFFTSFAFFAASAAFSTSLLSSAFFSLPSLIIQKYIKFAPLPLVAAPESIVLLPARGIAEQLHGSSAEQLHSSNRRQQSQQQQQCLQQRQQWDQSRLGLRCVFFSMASIFLRTSTRLWQSMLVDFLCFTFLFMAMEKSFSNFFSSSWWLRRVFRSEMMKSLTVTSFAPLSRSLPSSLMSFLLIVGSSDFSNLFLILATSLLQIWLNSTALNSSSSSPSRWFTLSNFSISSLTSWSSSGREWRAGRGWRRGRARVRRRMATQRRQSSFSWAFMYSLMRRLTRMNSSSCGESFLFSMSFMEQMVVSMACSFLWKFISATRHAVFLKVKKSIAPCSSPPRLHTFTRLSPEVVTTMAFSLTSSTRSTRSLCASHPTLRTNCCSGKAGAGSAEQPCISTFFFSLATVVLSECTSHLIDCLIVKIWWFCSTLKRTSSSVRFTSCTRPSSPPTTAIRCCSSAASPTSAPRRRQALITSSSPIALIRLGAPCGSEWVSLAKQWLRMAVSSQGRMQKKLMTPLSSTTTMMGWMGEKARCRILPRSTRTPSKVSFSRFQMLTTPSSLPVARVQYLAEASAQVSSKCVSRMSLMSWNSLSESLSQMSILPSRVQTMSRLCSLRKMILTTALFSQRLSSPGAMCCRKSPVSLQYSLTKPPASPRKNFRLLYPNSHAVMLVSKCASLSLVKTFSRQPVLQLQTLTSLEVKRKMLLLMEQMRKSKITWNSLISRDFFSREGARNWVTFFSQTRHSLSSGMISRREGLMKFFSQLMIWMVWKRRKSQMRMFSLSSKDSTQGKDFRNLAVIRLPPCSLYLPVKPFTSEMSREQTQMEEQKPQVRTQLPNSLVQSTPSTPFLYLEFIADVVCSAICSKFTLFFRQVEQNLTLPSMEEVRMQRGSSTSQTSVMRDSCCLMTETTEKSKLVLLLQLAVHSFISPVLDRKAQYLCSGRYSTLWQFASFFTSHSLQLFTLPSNFRLQYLALASKMAQKTMLPLSKAKSRICECGDSPCSSRQSCRAKCASQILSKLEAASSRQYFCSLAMQTIFLMQLLVPVSTTLVILYSLEILEQAEEMTSFSWKTLFLQLGRSTLRMFSMIYSVNSDHSRCPSPLMSMAWKNLMRSDTKQYLLISFSGEQSFFMRQMKVGSSRPLGQSSNSFSRIYMFSCDSIDMMRSMCYLLLFYFQKMCRFRLKYSTMSHTEPRLIRKLELQEIGSYRLFAG